MNLRNKRFIVGVLILIAFVGIGVFGLMPFTHASHAAEAPMVNCPYERGGFSLCDNSLIHIDNWKQFSNFILPSLLILLLAFALIWHFVSDFFNQEKYFYRNKYYLDNKTLYSYQKIITKWLSLFENSPSFLMVRHS